MEKVAILVDGGYYRKISAKVYGKVTAKERADELYSYCNRHLKRHISKKKYIINYTEYFTMIVLLFDKIVYHPLLKKNVNFSNTDTKKWTEDFFKEMSKKRKVALRLGQLSEYSVEYNLKYSITKKLLNGSIDLNDLKEKDFSLSLQQKVLI
ncbi:hypothetical protein ACVNP1_16375 [Staphylococcus aureus]